MDLVERKLKVIEAATRWAEVLRGDVTSSERVRARDAFSAELDEALTAIDQGAVDALRECHEALTSRQTSGERWRSAVASAARFIDHPGGQ